MLTIEQISVRGRVAVQQLRQQKFRANLPFMIYTKELPSHQFYLEYSNGIIKLAEIKGDGQAYFIHRDLTPAEANNIRRKFRLD